MAFFSLRAGAAETIVPVLEAAPLAVARVKRQHAASGGGGVDAFVALTHQVRRQKERGDGDNGRW